MHLAGSGKIIAALIQSVVVQVLGLIFFYLLSLHMGTDTFGLLSWLNAVSVFLTTVIGFGLEQIVMRRVAAGNKTSGWAATAFMYHSLLSSCFVLAFLLMLSLSLGHSHPRLALLPLFFLAQCTVLLVTPLKLLLNARSRFVPYAVIALGSNAGKLVWAAWLLKEGKSFDFNSVAIILISFGIAEIVATALYIKTAGLLPPLRVPIHGYKRLLNEAAPQYVSVLFDISLARADWILLGLLGTDAATGQYSFAYRAFEMLRIPAIGISLVLMPRLAQLLRKVDFLAKSTTGHINQFFRLEIWSVGTVALAMAILWTPIVGPLTHGRYGSPAETEAVLLALCLPLHYSINLMWMIGFNARKYKQLARITVITSLINLSLNLILIPRLGGTGAAIAFFAASALQVILYFRLVSHHGMILNPKPLLIALTAIVGFYLLSRVELFSMSRLQLGFASLAAYLFITAILRQWRRGDVTFIRRAIAS